MITKTPSKVGRPLIKTNKREQIFKAAKTLFTEMDYDKVSNRKIAKIAEVDPALIRYYFGSKMQLFATIIKDISLPIVKQIDLMHKERKQETSAEILTAYYQTMLKAPDFPMLIFRLGNADLAEKENKEIWELVTSILKPQEMHFFKILKDEKILKSHIDPDCAHISFLSLVIFPFLLPKNFRKTLHIEMNTDFLNQLAKHNIELLSQGLFHATDNIGEQIDGR